MISLVPSTFTGKSGTGNSSAIGVGGAGVGGPVRTGVVASPFAAALLNMGQFLFVFM